MAELSEVPAGEPRQDLSVLALFASPRGRIARRHWWIGTGLVWLALIAKYTVQMEVWERDSVPQWLVLVDLPLLWAGVVLQIKRWHDRGKSGWMTLVGLIPVIGWVWVLAELGVGLSVPGANRYGAPPD